MLQIHVIIWTNICSLSGSCSPIAAKEMILWWSVWSGLSILTSPMSHGMTSVFIELSELKLLHPSWPPRFLNFILAACGSPGCRKFSKIFPFWAAKRFHPKTLWIQVFSTPGQLAWSLVRLTILMEAAACSRDEPKPRKKLQPSEGNFAAQRQAKENIFSDFWKSGHWEVEVRA